MQSLFSTEHPEVFIQTHRWYGVPHSVTTMLGTNGPNLFVPSIYFQEPKTFPEGKYWNRIIAGNSDVEVQIGDKLYSRTVRLIEDLAEFVAALEALASKYDFWRNVQQNPDEAPTYVLFSLDDRVD